MRVNAEWLVREVPGIGRGLGAGLLEYPWWFGTETYSLQALMATGDFDLVKQTLRLLKNQSMKANGNGRIVHEVTTNGAVFNPGNTQETAQFILTVGRLVDWTGDLDFAKEMYPAMKLGIHWLLTDMDQNHDLFPEGYGIMEVYGLNAELVDVAVYTQQALKATAHIADILGETAAARAIRPAGVTAGNENQRQFLGRRGRLLRRLLWHQGPGDHRGTGCRDTDRTKGERQTDPKRPGTDRPLRAARAQICRHAREHQRMDHEQELGHHDADGNRHRPAGTSHTTAG